MFICSTVCRLFCSKEKASLLAPLAGHEPNVPLRAATWHQVQRGSFWLRPREQQISRSNMQGQPLFCKFHLAKQHQPEPKAGPMANGSTATTILHSYEIKTWLTQWMVSGMQNAFSRARRNILALASGFLTCWTCTGQALETKEACDLERWSFWRNLWSSRHCTITPIPQKFLGCWRMDFQPADQATFSKQGHRCYRCETGLINAQDVALCGFNSARDRLLILQ